MRPRSLLAVTLIAALPLFGCDFGQRFVQKPWGKGTFIPAAVCAAVGAGAGVGIQEERRGTTEVFVNGQKVADHKDDANYWEGALVGAAIGAAVCGLAGHYFLDKEEQPAVAAAPPPEPLPPPTSRRLVLRGVNFDFDQSGIRPDSRPILDEAAEVLKENRNVHISVEGHTDYIGTDEYNEKLSVRRAETVFRYLVNRGIAPERMSAIGYGRSRPVADNSTESGRAQNRRVELRVLGAPPAESAAPGEPPQQEGEPRP